MQEGVDGAHIQAAAEGQSCVGRLHLHRDLLSCVEPHLWKWTTGSENPSDRDLVVLKMSGNGSQTSTVSQSDGRQVTEYLDLGALVV